MAQSVDIVRSGPLAPSVRDEIQTDALLGREIDRSPAGRTRSWIVSRLMYGDRRIFDLLIASLVLLVLLVPLAIVAVVVGVTSPGGVFYSQTRCGKNGKPFRLYKFRSMVKTADARLITDPGFGKAFEEQWKLANDPRITRVGRVLRKTSIDELPQLINVLRGEMSIVGPRPVQPAEYTELYGERAATVFSAKPGLTGLWQVSGRSAMTYDERVALDLEYVSRRSLPFDMMLILKTIPAVVTMRGAV